MKSIIHDYEIRKPKLSLENLSQLLCRTSTKTHWRLYTTALLGNDIIMISIALWISYIIRFKSNLPVFQLNVDPSVILYTQLTLLCIPVFVLTFTASGLYNKLYLLGGITEYSLVFRASSISMFLLIMAGFIEPRFVIARGWLFLTWIFSFALVITGRFFLRRGVYELRRRGYFTSPALLVGANDEGISLAKQLIEWPTSGMRLVGFVDKKLPLGTVLFDNMQVLGSVDQLDYLIKQHHIEELILATSSISTRDKMLEIFQKYGIFNGVNLRLSSGLYEIITTGLTVKEFAYVPLVYVNKVRLTGLDRLVKGLIDYSLAIPILILISPLLALIALAIKLDSPGPVFHKRKVMGVSGTQFDALKFRTMFENGYEILSIRHELVEELSKNHKLKNDPRITRLGKFLRRFSLDELPQLINVIFHQMSLVGPRMISPSEMKEYSRWGINLLTVRPGITGLWQISGRSDVSYEERVRLDMHYIRNWSFWVDLQLLLKTIPAVIKGKGAY
jgi:exopolysaccharide biosynthesis polyprenyl glycosylphosphotransferase